MNISKKYRVISTSTNVKNFQVQCCILRGPSGIVDIVPGGMDLELQLRRGIGQAAHTRNNPHVKCIGVYCA